MRFEVDLAVCRNLGQCTFSAPDVFSLDAAGELSFRASGTNPYLSGDVPAEFEEDVRDAADMCPTLAISVVDE